MKKALNYWHLIRGNKPIGTILLWIPTAWALWIANDGIPNQNILFYFLLGTFLMRSIGCILNDRADRKIDLHVSRTRLRPLVAQTLSVREADILLYSLLLLAFLILLRLPHECLYEAIIGFIITICYPYFKRFFPMPQLILSLAFSMGIPMAYTASGKPFDWSLVILWLLNMGWVIAYDTQYALIDKEDDLKIGVYSTAIFFGQYARNIINILLIIVHVLWLYLGYYLDYSLYFYVAWGSAGLVFIYQYYLLKKAETPQVRGEAYWYAFLSHSVYGGILWLGQMIQ